LLLAAPGVVIAGALLLIAGGALDVMIDGASKRIVTLVLLVAPFASLAFLATVVGGIGEGERDEDLLDLAAQAHEQHIEHRAEGELVRLPRAEEQDERRDQPHLKNDHDGHRHGRESEAEAGLLPLKAIRLQARNDHHEG